MPASSATATPIVTLSLLRYQGWARRWWAFVDMGRGLAPLAGTPGLRFVKKLGSGGGNGFGIQPNWGVYALLAAWDSEAHARAFFNSHAWWLATGQQASERWTAYLHTAAAHGQWDGLSPFEPTTPFDPTQPVAVLTRAAIRTRHLWRFWRYVPAVSASVKDRPGEILSVGVGEWPLIQQATFSLWTSGQHMLNYAYHSPHHRAVVQRTRQLGWYSEELFARFVPYASAGSWGGVDPLNAVGAPHPTAAP